MGSGGKKAHEAFTIAPAPDLDEHIGDGAPLTALAGELDGGAAPSAQPLLDAAVATQTATCALCGKSFPAEKIAHTDGGICPDCSAVAAGGSAAAPGLQGEELTELEELLNTVAGDAENDAGDPLPTTEEPSSSKGPDAEHVEVVQPSASSADADGGDPTWADDDLITPIPEKLDIGDGIGVAVAVGGADLLDGAAILTSYKDTKGGASHEVLRATLTPDAEEKLLDALSPPDAPKVPIQVPETVTGRLPVDKEQKLHEELSRAAKSINSHQKSGTPIPQHTIDRIDAVDKKLQALEQSAGADSAEHLMVKHYQDGLEQCKQRMADGFSTPYSQGGKIPMINAFEHTGEVMVTKMVPDPTFQGAGLAVDKRKMSRIAAAMDGRESTWDGKSRNELHGTELAIDLGDGFQAVVRPTSMNPPGQCGASLRGTLEITAPPGAGHQKQLLDKLGNLNIVSRPMSAAEAEWTYLQRNIAARNIDSHSAVTAALQSAADLEEAHAHRLLMKRASQAIGLDDAGLAQFARKLQLDAEADALGDKVSLLKDGVAKALGHNDGAAMAKALSYDPRPHRARGWLTWGRIGQGAADLKPVFTGKVMTHHITGGHHNLAAVLTSGVLACTERRRMMGVQAGLGMSESSDMNSGGANSVFLRMQSKGSSLSGPRMIWNNPEKLLSRTDWYAYNGDHFGAAIAGTGHSTAGQTRDPHKVATHTSASNEVMISHGLDLLGADAPDKVLCPTNYRSTLLAELAKAGITTIGGRPVEKVVVSK